MERLKALQAMVGRKVTVKHHPHDVGTFDLLREIGGNRFAVGRREFAAEQVHIAEDGSLHIQPGRGG